MMKRYSLDANDNATNVEMLELKVFAFKKIYQALRSGQNNMLKSNFMAGKAHLNSVELVQDILIHSAINPDSRTATAWTLAVAHYQNCNSMNPILFNEIYHYATANTKYFGTSFFNPFISLPARAFTESQIRDGEHKNFDEICTLIVKELDSDLHVKFKFSTRP